MTAKKKTEDVSLPVMGNDIVETNPDVENEEPEAPVGEKNPSTYSVEGFQGNPIVVAPVAHAVVRQPTDGPYLDDHQPTAVVKEGDDGETPIIIPNDDDE